MESMNSSMVESTAQEAVNIIGHDDAPGALPVDEQDSPVGSAVKKAVNDKAQQARYDADAEQEFNFIFQGRGKMAGKEYPVTITFAPVKDGDFVAYDKQRDIRLTGEPDGLATSNETFGAALWLGKKVLKSVLGWGAEDGSNLSDDRLVDAVQNALIACDIEPRGASITGEAATDNPWEEDETAAQPIGLRCIAGGRLLITTHTPDAVDEEKLSRQRKRYNRLKSRGKLVEGDKIGRRETKVPSRADEKGKIYDELQFVATGYAGRIPLWHKEAIVDDFFSVEQELIEKK